MLSGLSGKFEMAVDAKGRVTLPSAFRKQLAAEGTKSIKLVPFSGCLNGFTEEGFKQWVDGLFNVGDKCYNPRDAKDVRLHDGLWQSAITIDLDSAGRVALGSAFPAMSSSPAWTITLPSGTPRGGTRSTTTSTTTSTR